MKIVITGGHFSPAYSVIQKIRNSDEVLVIGRRYAFEGDEGETFEYKLCSKNNIPFEILNSGRLQRKLTSRTIPSFLKFPKGIYQAINILRKYRPDVVVTFGGYIGLPVALAAKILHIPVVLHEQTQKAGLSAVLISKVASVVLISFDSSKRYFKNKKTILTGNPIRPEFFEEPKNNFTIQKPAIYITGGSTGSHFINEMIGQIIPQLTQKYQVFHQSGNSSEYRDYDKLSRLQNHNYVISQFFTPLEVFELLRKSDLVISRAGINTITEIIATNAAALLIPLPHGQRNEQMDNAIFVKNMGIGEYMLQDEITPLSLLDQINVMIKEQKKYRTHSLSASKSIRIDAVDKIIEQIYLYGRRGKGRTSY